jgi:SAM-dependent methyltransferase
MSLLRDVVRKHATQSRIQRAQYVGLTVVDALDRVRGRTDPELPPKRLRHFVGAGDFRATGEEFATHARRLVSLEPSDRVLDVGSGIGRIALPLTRILDPSGGYDGIEIVKTGVDWCRRNFTAKHPHFRFHHSDIYNGTYNPGGRLRADEYRFPFEDDTFDVVLLTLGLHPPAPVDDRPLRSRDQPDASPRRAGAGDLLRPRRRVAAAPGRGP